MADNVSVDANGVINVLQQRLNDEILGRTIAEVALQEAQAKVAELERSIAELKVAG